MNKLFNSSHTILYNCNRGHSKWVLLQVKVATEQGLQGLD